MKNNKKCCKLPCTACLRHYSFILGGDGLSTQTSYKKVSIVVENLKTLTAYQVYNEFNQKKNQKRYVTDITKEDFVEIFKNQPKFVPTIILEYNDSFNPYFVGKITGATLNKDGKLVLEISSRGFCMKSKFKDCMPKGQLKGMRIQIDPTIVFLGSGSEVDPFVDSDSGSDSDSDISD
jgi:hypothetical protein